MRAVDLAVVKVGTLAVVLAAMKVDLKAVKRVERTAEE